MRTGPAHSRCSANSSVRRGEAAAESGVSSSTEKSPGQEVAVLMEQGEFFKNTLPQAPHPGESDLMTLHRAFKAMIFQAPRGDSNKQPGLGR